MSDTDKFGVILNLIANIDRRLDGIEHDGVETRAALTETRAAIMDRIDRLQNLLGLLRDDIGVNFGRADRAVDAALGVRREVEALGREVTAMERQIQGLQSQVRELQERGGH
jgi:predicted  nucleic acid-binding Zn-ribbon protein